MMKQHWLWALWLCLLAGCSLGGPQVDTCDRSGALFFDNFSGDQNCGWREYNESGVVVQINPDAEALQISVSQPGQIGWTNPDRVFDNVIITTNATQVSGPDDNAYGVICRYQDENNFYVFLISGDGYYAIGKYQTGSPQIIYLTDNYIQSDAILQGASMNQLRVSCVGNELGLQINGVPVTTVVDPTFVRGDVGLGASVFAPGTAVIQFDDFRVIQP
ncbi:MAG: hypothetical protein KF770_10545 [Anaerolineae bacterium]|nr:hypothetical protein [Anaerolineae bacterium]